MNATVRSSLLVDLDLHARHRVGMFKDMAMGDEAGLARMNERFKAWLRSRLITGEVRGYVAEVYGVAVGSALLWMREHMPVPVSELDLRGQVFNVFIEPAHRGQGYARLLMQHLETQAQGLGLELLELHASKDAEKLYVELGYEPTSEMRKVISERVQVSHQWKERR